MKRLEKHKILTDQQYGFRKRSCESQLILTVQDLAEGLRDGNRLLQCFDLTEGLRDKEQIDAVLLDFSKAFDKVPHHQIATKLDH